VQRTNRRANIPGDSGKTFGCPVLLQRQYSVPITYAGHAAIQQEIASKDCMLRLAQFLSRAATIKVCVIATSQSRLCASSIVSAFSGQIQPETNPPAAAEVGICH
jgi:hypothetical protein